MSQFSYDDNFYGNITPVEDLILKHNAVDASYQKMVELDTTIAAKQAMIEATRRDKELSLNGFTKAQVLMDDPDSGTLPDGTKFRFDNLDALDSQSSFGKGRKSEFAMQLQNKQVAQMYGVAEEFVTPEMWQNATNYQYNEFLRSMTNPDAKFEQFDSNRVYGTVDLKNTPLEIAFRPTGKVDDFGRQFVEAINPVTGRRVSDEMSSNPYLSARNSKSGFDLYTALRNNLPDEKPDSSAMQGVRRYVDNSQRSIQEIKEAFDTDGRLAESIDMVQSAAYRSAARVLQYGPDFLVDTDKWKNIASEKNGQALVDAWAGVKQNTREDYQQQTQEAIKAIEDGDYLKAIMISATQFDRLLADSAVQMGLMTVGTLATGGGAAGASIAARLGGMLLGASAASIDVTLGMREQYKENNNGKEMPWEDTLMHWAANTALLMPDAFMIGLNASKIFAKPVNEALETAYRLKKLPSRAKIVGMSALEETLQEWTQESYENWGSQDQSNKKSFWEVMKSAESQYAAVAGGVMGGGMSGIAQTTGAAINTRRDIKHDKALKEQVEQYRGTTSTGEKADIELSTKVLTDIKTSSDLTQLTDIIHTPGISNEAKNAAQQRRIEIITEQIKAEEAAKSKGESVTSILPEGTTKQSLFEEKASLIFHSDPSISMESKRAQIEEAGKELGVSKEVIKKTIQEVSNDVKYGPIGYYTYRDDIKYYTSEIDKINKNTSLTEEQKTQQLDKFETAKVRTESKLRGLQNLQTRKLGSFVIALGELATGGAAEARAKYPRGGGFDIKVDDIRSGSFELGNALFGVINNIKSEINEMTSVMQELGIEPDAKTISDMQSHIKSIDANINTIQGKTATNRDVQKAIKKDKTTPSDKDIVLDESSLKGQISTLERLSDIQSKGKKLGAEVQGFIQGRGENQIKQIQDYLVTNPNEKASKMLSQILSNRTESTKRNVNVKANTSKVLTEVTNRKSDFTEAAIDKLSTVDEATKFLEDIRDVKSLLSQVEGNNTEIEELAKYYKDIGVKAAQKGREIGIKAIEEAKTKSEQTESQQTTNESDTSNYIIQTIFKTVSSTFSGVDGVQFNLADELKVVEPESKIAIEDVTKYPFASTLGNLKKLSSNLIPNKIVNTLAYFKKLKPSTDKNTGEVTYSNMWENTPYMRLLYDFIINGNKIDFELNRSVGITLDYSLRQWFAQMSVDNTFRPRKRKDIAKLFGMDVNSEEFNNRFNDLKSIVNQYGVPRNIMADKLGELILQNLGLEKKEDTGHRNFYELVASGLGTFAFRYAEENGWITQQTYNKDEWQKTHLNEDGTSRVAPLDYNVPFIKPTSNKIIRAVKNSYKQVEYLKNENNPSSTKPHAKPTKVKNNLKVKHTNGRMNVPAFVKNIFNKLHNTAYVVNTELVSEVLENLDAIKARLEYLTEDELNDLGFDERESGEGVNQSVESTLEELQNIYEELKNRDNKSYFNYFFSKNGRIFLDSTTVNPQTNKFLRFLMLPEKVQRKFDPSNSEHIKSMNYAIAQAFDSLKTQKQIDELATKVIAQDPKKMRNDLITMSEEDFLDTYKNTGIKGIENFAQALNVLQHIEQLKANTNLDIEVVADGKMTLAEFLAANSKPFDSWLAIENDSTTSGYFIRFLQFPTEKLKGFWEKVGIITDPSRNNTMHELKQLDDFLDIYKTMAQATKLDEIDVTILDGMLRHGYDLMSDALPRPNEDGSIGSSLRKLFKNPAMIFGYTAGMKSISTSLADEISLGMIKDYIKMVDGSNKLGSFDNYLNQKGKDGKPKFDKTAQARIKSIKSTMDFMASKYSGGSYFDENGKRVSIAKGDIYTALKKVSRVDILLNIPYTKTVGDSVYKYKTITVGKFFQETLAPTYGQAVWNALNKSFEPFLEYNDAMNTMFNTMFEAFDIALSEKEKDLKAKYGKYIPIKAEKEAIEELYAIMPTLPLLYDITNNSEGMLLINSERQRDNDSQTQVPYSRDGQAQKPDSSFANIRKFINAGKAGAVLPIHFIDGMIMSLVMQKYDDRIIGVHDAIVMSALDNSEITSYYNEVSFALNKDYDIFTELVTRFMDVIHVAQNEFGQTDILNKSIYQKFPKIIDGTKIDPPTIGEFITTINKMAINNQKDRNTFFDAQNKYTIANMDGTSVYQTTGYESLIGMMFLEGWETNKNIMKRIFGAKYSDPNTFTSDAQLVELQRNGLEHVGVRNEIFDRLQAMFPDMVKDIGHIGTLRKIVSKIAPEHIMDFVVATRENIANAGTLDGNTIIIDLDNRTSIDSTTRLSPFSTKSPMEIYAHEMVHAAIRFALGVGKSKFTKEIRQVSNIMKQIIDTDLITWQDFMPEGEYNKALSDVYEKNAKDIWNYIFNNKDNVANLSGIHEFVAYSMTNKKVMDKLRNQNIKGIESTSTDKVSLLDRLVNFGMSLIDFVRGPNSTKFKEIFRSGYELVSNDFSMSQRNTMLSEMERLFMSMNNANEKAITRLRDHPVRAIENMFKFTTKIAVQANKIIRPYTTWAANWVDETGYVFKKDEIPGTMFEQSKMFANIILGLLFSRTRRQALTGALRKAVGLSQQGVFATILRELQAPDEATAMLEQLSAYTRQLEGISKTIESDMKLNFREAFNPTFDENKDLKEIEKSSLTKAVLFTDLGSLLKFDGNKVTNIDEIIDYLNDSNKVTSEIKRLTTELAKTGKHNNYYLNQARLLGRFMATGKGAINLNLNAKNIAEGRGSSNIINATPETIAMIDRLATMYALDYTPEDAKKITGSLNKKGLENFLVAQNTFVKESLAEGVVEEFHSIKGYTKSIFDSNKDTKIGRIQDQQKMKQAGYHIVEGKFFGQNTITEQEGFVLYQRNWTVQRRRDGSAFVMVGANTMGTTLWESALEILNRIPGNTTDITQVNELADRYKLKAETLARDMTERMSKGIISDEEVDRISGGYTPVTSPDGGYSDFRITMSNEDKVKYLGMKEDAFTVLAKMYASKNTKLQAPVKNKFLIDFLVNDMKLNMQSNTKMSKLGKNYVRLERDSENKFVRDAYNSFPKELRDAIRKYDKEGEGLWVKDEWVQQLFGVPTVSLTDNKYIEKYANNLTKYGIIVAEQIMKAIAYLAKQNIVIRYPAVLLGNIVSNLNLSIARGRNPSVVARRQIENAQNIRDYMSNQKALNRILTRQKFGTVTEKELNSINLYETRLANNPIKPLMDKGMFQAIMEDISLDELENTGKINKMITTFAKNKGVPTKLRNAIKHLYMLEGTPIYDFMFQTTQYSDFVARATEYQLQMEEQRREPKFLKNGASNPAYIEKGTPAWDAFETKVSTDVWNAFINYDKPQSSLEQYANDMGLIMFTKFLKRIQHVLMHDLIHNPVSSAFFIASQVAIMDTSDIFEYNVFNRNITWNMFAPWTNFANAAVPIPIQFVTGTGLF